MSNITSRVTAQLSRFLRIQNTLEDAMEGETDSVTRHLINTRLEILENNWTKFQSEHKSLCLEGPEFVDDLSYIKTKTFERCQEFYVQARATLLSRQEEMEASNASMKSSDLSTNTLYATDNRRGLPRLEMPKISGDYNTWQSFRDLFLSMVGNNSALDNVEKMHYLKTSLFGDAAKLVTNILVSGDSFPIAWNELVARYENKRILILANLDKLADMKPVQTKSSCELNKLISTVSETIGALKALGCPVEHWDMTLVHQLSRLLDPETQEAWELKLGSTHSFLTFKQFKEFLVGQSLAWERLESQTAGKPTGKSRLLHPSNKQEGRSRSLVATTPHTPGHSCQMCKSEHFLYLCPEFKAMDAKRKRRFITEQRLCFNCFGTHAMARCSNTRRCIKCGQKHHTMIHESMKSGQSLTTAIDTEKQKAEASKTQETTGSDPEPFPSE